VIRILALVLVGAGWCASMWADGAGSLYVDHKARKVGDILTVIVSETTTANKEATTETKRDTAIDGQVTSAFFPAWGTHKGQLPIWGVDSSQTYTGEGKTDRKASLSGRIAVVVVDVLPNGNLVVEGKRAVVVNGEDEVMVLRGVVRPRDIGPDNTVLSTYIADAAIDFSGKGVVSERQRPGLITRFIDLLRLF